MRPVCSARTAACFPPAQLQPSSDMRAKIKHRLMQLRALQAVTWGAQLVPYGHALRLQQLLAEQRQAEAAQDTLLLLQHAPVYTIGKRGSLADFKTPMTVCAAPGPLPRLLPAAVPLCDHACRS